MTSNFTEMISNFTKMIIIVYSSESEDYVEINENSEVKKQKETNLVF